jgi:hypothetical protein
MNGLQAESVVDWRFYSFSKSLYFHTKRYHRYQCRALPFFRKSYSDLFGKPGAGHRDDDHRGKGKEGRQGQDAPVHQWRWSQMGIQRGKHPGRQQKEHSPRQHHKAQMLSRSDLGR